MFNPHDTFEKKHIAYQIGGGGGGQAAAAAAGSMPRAGSQFSTVGGAVKQHHEAELGSFGELYTMR